jgi:site-specific DNA recombinase
MATTKTAQQAVGYIRVSTADQAADGVSLDAQRARIEAYCLANGLTLRAVHVDAGLSGKRADNRPGLQAALADVCECSGVLVVYSLSRMARSTADTIAISQQLQAAGADLASLTEKLDTTSAAGRVLFTLIAAFAQFERDLCSERTITALQHKKSQGQRVGTVPFGFDLSADGVTLTPNAAQQAIITTIRELRAAGATLQGIADYLQSQGILTAKGSSKWQPKTIDRILKAA